MCNYYQFLPKTCWNNFISQVLHLTCSKGGQHNNSKVVIMNVCTWNEILLDYLLCNQILGTKWNSAGIYHHWCLGYLVLNYICLTLIFWTSHATVNWLSQLWESSDCKVILNRVLTVICGCLFTLLWMIELRTCLYNW